jgi:molybdopterin-guanine dinucleotide biosynthesis protein B
VIGLAGWSGAGKTTLLTKLIPVLNGRGITVSTLKHAHHGFDVDRPGKDSFEHRAAGAQEVLVASGRRWALVHELRGAPEPSLAALLERLSPVDLVIVEGFKAARHPKIEVHRAANGKPFCSATCRTSAPSPADVAVPQSPVPVIPLDDVDAVTDAVLAHAAALEDVLAALAAERAGPVLAGASASA